MNRTVSATLASLIAAALLAAPPLAQADESAIRKALEPTLGRIDAVAKSPVPDVWEVVTGAKVQYTDAQGRFVFEGPLRDTASGRDLTAQRQYALLPLNLALVHKRGNGKNVLVTFEDPNCGFCKKLATELLKIPDLTVYTFVYPVLGANSLEKSRDIWCAASPLAAWNNLMLEGKAPPAAAPGCDSAGIQKTIDLGRQLGIRGTPHLMLENGEILRGYMDAAKLAEKLQVVRQSKIAPKS